MADDATAARLELVETEREVDAESGPAKTRRRFLDFVVDGSPLYIEMQRRGFDRITPLWRSDTAPGAKEQVVGRLAGDVPGDAPGGRVCVYICPECGDLGCGAVTVSVVVTP